MAKTRRKAIESSAAPAAIGPYSQAILHDKWLFCSGQIGLDHQTGRIVDGGIEAQTRRALDNLRAILAEAGMTFKDVVKTTIFLADMEDFPIVNRVYSEHFTPPYPARSTVQVAGLPRGARIEIEAIAVKRGES